MRSLDQHTGFTLDELVVSPSHNTLSAMGKTVKLQPKAMAVLCYLANHYQRVISNEELIEHLWAGRVVTHGSVQKSINSLRSAFSEFMGDREIIAHYSKRGYQLTIEPQFASPASLPPITEPSPTTSSRWPGRLPKAYLWASVSLAILVVASLAAYKLLSPVSLAKHHETRFHTTQGYTNETGHERAATPHPDNQHLAYIREKFNSKLQGETESEIVIRNAAGKDWKIATSQGSWFKLAWSPTGKNLVAVEVKRRDGQPLAANFNEKPSFLYSFHIFALDINQERLLEKQQLSQWQGRIFSVTWWDENTLEIVAKQGVSSGNGRYRYSIVDQQLSTLDEVEGATNPVSSAVLNQKTALASLHRGALRIDFLNQKQARIKQVQLDVGAGDISWIPDGSGVLVYAEDERKLLAVYLDGQQVQIPLADMKDKVWSRPRYRPDGKGIYFTEEKRSSNIFLLNSDGLKTPLTENTDLNYAASFSPRGDKVVYASVRSNQIHLWLVEAGQERQLTRQPIPQRVGAIIWSGDGEHLVFNAGTRVYEHDLVTSQTSLLVDGSERLEPLAWFPNTHKLLAIKTNGETRNLWRIDTRTRQQKQLTFGSVGSAVEYEGDVIFQFPDEDLWVLRGKDDTLESLKLKLGEYSKLLKADARGVYFVRGGSCHESDIYYLDYANPTPVAFLKRPDKVIATSSFHPAKGALYTECYLPEANIVLMK